MSVFTVACLWRHKLLDKMDRGNILVGMGFRFASNTPMITCIGTGMVNAKQGTGASRNLGVRYGYGKRRLVDSSKIRSVERSAGQIRIQCGKWRIMFTAWGHIISVLHHIHIQRSNMNIFYCFRRCKEAVWNVPIFTSPTSLCAWEPHWGNWSRENARGWHPTPITAFWSTRTWSRLRSLKLVTHQSLILAVGLTS